MLVNKTLKHLSWYKVKTRIYLTRVFFCKSRICSQDTCVHRNCTGNILMDCLHKDQRRRENWAYLVCESLNSASTLCKKELNNVISRSVVAWTTQWQNSISLTMSLVKIYSKRHRTNYPRVRLQNLNAIKIEAGKCENSNISACNTCFRRAKIFCDTFEIKELFG